MYFGIAIFFFFFVFKINTGTTDSFFTCLLPFFSYPISIVRRSFVSQPFRRYFSVLMCTEINTEINTWNKYIKVLKSEKKPKKTNILQFGSEFLRQFSLSEDPFIQSHIIRTSIYQRILTGKTMPRFLSRRVGDNNIDRYITSHFQGYALAIRKQEIDMKCLINERE